MPILKLNAENIGPFDKLELDLTDGKGNAHLGPHILAGVNGFGKTTVLKAIAKCLSLRSPDSGFDDEEFRAFIKGRTGKYLELDPGGANKLKLNLDKGGIFRDLGVSAPALSLGCVASYAPHPALKWLERPPIAIAEGASGNWLSFQRTVSNELVQAYWVSAFSRESLAKTGGQGNSQAAEAVSALRAAIREIMGTRCEPGVNIESTFVQPALSVGGTNLNFSQLAAGFNATLGWVVDYLWRRESFDWTGSSATSKPGVILIDEIETHLHPQWQRRILNGIRAAFPNTQIIVTTHSPFVVSSCEEARVHVLKLDTHGKAYLDRSIDKADGVSVAATIASVFDIKSQFGPEIESELREWNDLKKRESVGKLATQDKAKLKKISRELASRGEELALMVREPVFSPALLEELEEFIESSSSKPR